MISCVICGAPIENPTVTSAYRRVSGWVRRREDGGVNAIRLRRELDEWAHVTCVDRAAAGLEGQGGLF